MTYVPFFILFLAAFTAGQLSFTQQPSFTKDAQNRFWVEFTVSANTDVAVSIVDLSDSSVVRSLAAGMLGANPPAPLAASSLHQKIEWDGKDDLGNTVANPDLLAARVRAGMGVRMANIAGENLYVFNTSFGGIVPGPSGSLFIYGSAGTGNSRSYFLRQYDASGAYMRTVYPPATGLPSDSVQGYGINVLPGSGWAPKTTAVYNPMITSSFLTRTGTQLLPLGSAGELALVNGTDLQIISESGALANTTTRKIISSPAGPAGFNLMGPHYFTASFSPDYLYLSGWYYGTMDMGCWLINACDTGFWADGQVFKVNRRTGVVSPWLKMDSIPVNKTERLAKLGGGANATATLHGVALDDAGHVFVCDRLNRRIGVYDTNAVLVGAVACVNPDFVAVSKRTGAIYVITRSDASMNLVKFAGWQTPGAAVAAAVLTTSINTYTGASCLVLTEDASTTCVWAGYERFGIRQYRDNGTSFTLLRDFSANPGNLVYDRLAVDRRTEKTYVTDSYSGFYKIEHWWNPVFARCSTSTKQVLYAGDVSVSPSGVLYIRGANAFNGPIERYTQDHLHAPVNYANTGANKATGDLYGRMGIGWGDKGFAVNRQGQIGAIYMAGWNDYVFDLFPDNGGTATSGTRAVSTLGGQCGGMKFDDNGNFYLGMDALAPSRIVPSGFASDWGFSMGGAVVKYSYGTTGSLSGNTAVGAAKVYPQPYGAFSADGGSACVCRSPRFDLDPYGRLFMPHGAAGTVYVADNEGNTILSFGQYGNTDSRGGLTGPGQTQPQPAFPLGWPIAVAASEDFIYINDWINSRLVRVQMTYALDNMPGLTLHGLAAEMKIPFEGLAMTSTPNPCSPLSRIQVVLPAAGRAQLSVYNTAGKLVRTISDRKLESGVHAFTWRGDDELDRPVSAGLYVVRLTVGKRTLIHKTVLAK